MITLKLRFRVTAVCLAAFLVLGVLPSGSVYADNEMSEETIVMSNDETGSSAYSANETQGDSSGDSTNETQANSSGDNTNETQANSSGDSANETQADSSGDSTNETQADSSGDSANEPQGSSSEDSANGNQGDSSEVNSNKDLTNSSEDSSNENQAEPSEETSGTDTELQAPAPDASAIDEAALTAWVQEHQEQLSQLYAGDEAAITALAEALNAEPEVVRTYVSMLKDQNDLLVKAIENGTDVLTIISMNSPATSAAQLGVNETAICLFGIKLGYLSDLLIADGNAAEENGQEAAWYQELGEALGDETKLSALAEQYDVEPAVLATFLQTMNITAISISNTLTIKNTVVDAPADKSHAFSYTVLAWDPSYSNRNRGLSGIYGNVSFTCSRFYAMNLTDTVTLPAGYYGCATVSLTSNQSIEITNLPDSYSYCIIWNINNSSVNTENNDSQYYLMDLTSTSGVGNTLYGTICETNVSGENQVEFTYGYSTSYLRLGTEAYKDYTTGTDEEFEFTIYLYKTGSGSNLPLLDQDSVAIDIVSYGSGSSDLGGSVTFSRTGSITLPGLGVSGDYNAATIKLKSGQSVVFKNLGSNYGFYIVETENIHYMVGNYATRVIYTGLSNHNHGTTPACSYSGRYIYKDDIGDDCIENASIDFINYQVSLSITKQVVNSNTTRDFVFNVFLVQIVPDTYGYIPLTEGDYTLTRTSGTTSTTEMIHIQPSSYITHDEKKFTDMYENAGFCQWSVIQLRVAAGETVTISDLPEGTAYDIVEVPIPNYTTSATARYGTVGSGGNVYLSSYLYRNESVTFTNTYVPPDGVDLTISKTVTGNLGDRSQTFTFSITLTDQDGNPLSNQDFPVLLPDAAEATIYTTDANGILTVSLKHGQQATLEALPNGTHYTITETGAEYYTTKFTVTGDSSASSDGQTISGTLGSDVTVQVHNDLTVAIPTGIRTELRPSLLLLVFALGALLLMGLCKRKQQFHQ